jgi:hypothetical protein
MCIGFFLFLSIRKKNILLQIHFSFGKHICIKGDILKKKIEKGIGTFMPTANNVKVSLK